MAHRISEEPDEEYAAELLAALGQHLKDLVARFVDKKSEWRWDDWLQRLRLCVLAMCISLNVEEERHAEGKARLRASAEHLLATFAARSRAGQDGQPTQPLEDG